MRRITYILLAVLVVVALAGGAYFWYQIAGKNTTAAPGGSADFFSSLFPFGNTPNTSHTNGANGTENQQENAIAPRLRQVSAAPVSGFGVIERNGDTIIQYMDRATGNIYETYASTTAVSRISITTVPRIEEALWLGDKHVIMRYLDQDGTIVTFSANVSSSTDATHPGELSGTFLPANITTLTARPDGKQIFYMTKDASGAHGFTANIDGSKVVTVFESPFSSWQAQWAATSTIILTTNASAEAPGVTYALSPTGALTRLIGPFAGLTAKANDTGATVFFSRSQDTSFVSGFYSLKQGFVAASAIPSLTEKCTWGSQSTTTMYCGAESAPTASTYPDNWYQGITSFNDDIWALDATGKPAQLLEISSNSIPGGLDLIHPKTDAHTQYLVFMNKNDLSLWSLQLQ